MFGGSDGEILVLIHIAVYICSSHMLGANPAKIGPISNRKISYVLHFFKGTAPPSNGTC